MLPIIQNYVYPTYLADTLNLFVITDTHCKHRRKIFKRIIQTRRRETFQIKSYKRDTSGG